MRASRRQIGLNPRIKIDVREMLARTGGRGIDAPEEPDPGDLDPDDLAGDLLPDWYEDWVLAERERIRQARLHALEALCIQLTRAGRFAEAVDVGLSAVAGEPLRESAQRTLIEAFLAEGNRTEAVRQYTAYRRLLLDELGLEPSPAMASLVGA